MLGQPAPVRFGHFDVVELDNGVSLDFANAEGAIRPQHYAFLISEGISTQSLAASASGDWTIAPTRRDTAPARLITSAAGAVSTFPTPTATNLK
jgi:hypothetical protein